MERRAGWGLCVCAVCVSSVIVCPVSQSVSQYLELVYHQGLLGPPDEGRARLLGPLPAGAHKGVLVVRDCWWLCRASVERKVSHGFDPYTSVVAHKKKRKSSLNCTDLRPPPRTRPCTPARTRPTRHAGGRRPPRCPRPAAGSILVLIGDIIVGVVVSPSFLQ